MSKATEKMIKDLLQINPEKRLTATQVREQLKAIIHARNSVENTDHLVPELDFTSGDDSNQPLSATEIFNEKWKKTLAQNDNDQVVPSMSSKVNEVPATDTRKRRKSKEEVLNNMSQSGISVQHVPHDARQLSSDDIGKLQQLFRSSNQNRFGSAAFSDTVRPTPPSVFSPGSNRSAMSSVLRLFSNRNANRSNASNADSRATSLNGLPPRVGRQDAPTTNPNWRFLRLGNTMLNDLFRCAVVGRNPNASNIANRQNEQVRMIRRIRRAQQNSTTSNHSSR